MPRRFGPDVRVWITGDHPWTGRAGTIIERMGVEGTWGWSVEVDGTSGLRSFVEARLLRLAEH